MDGSTALAVLGLEPGATKQQVKTTFRALVKGAHPDAFGVESTDRFVELRIAYERALVDAPAAPAPATAAPAAEAPVAPRAESVEPTVVTRTVGAWFTSARPTTGIDITDVAPATAATLRSAAFASVVRPTGRSATIARSGSVVNEAEQAFAALLADELAAA